MGQAEGSPGGQGSGGAPARIEDKYFLQKVKLGQGSFGTVWRGVDKTQEGKVVAIKQLDKAAMPKRGVTRKEIEREVELIKAVRHENVTQLFDYYEDDKSIYLALEYCDGGDFGDKVNEKGLDLQESEAADWMAQICSAILALHCKGICHRDIKPDNFMVAGATLKLSDFGLACFLQRGKLLTEKCGTPAFMSPEQVQLGNRQGNQSRGYGFPCDMWAAGISMYMLMFGGRHPFLTSNNQLDSNLLLNGKLDFRERSQPTGGFFGGLLGGQTSSLRFSDAARNICSRMVQPQVDKRITAEAALKDEWLVQGLGQVRRRKSEAPSRGGASPATPHDPQRQAAMSPTAGYPQQHEAQPRIARRDTRPENAVRNDAQLQQQKQQMAQEVLEKERRIKSLEKKVIGLQGELDAASTPTAAPAPVMPPKTNLAPLKAGPLRPGIRCRYFSGTYGWMPGTVTGINQQDGTFNLDVRQHAAPDKIAPPEAIQAENDTWPNGTWVWYKSTSHQSSFPGVITGYNAADNTYNLDVREHAAIERIRARNGDGPPVDDISTTRHDGMRTEAGPGQSPVDFEGQSSTGGTPAAGMPPVAVQAQAAQPRERYGPDGFSAQTPQATQRRSPNQQPVRPPDGSKCMLKDDQGQMTPAIIEGYTMEDGSYSLLVDPNGARRRQQVRPDQVRAPPHAPDAWPPGTHVMYESASFGTPMPGIIITFNYPTSTYNLDVREGAQPERIRPR